MKAFLGAAAVAVALAVVVGPAKESRAAMAVYDAANHEANAKNLAETIKMLSETKHILDQATRMRQALGSIGPSSFGAASFQSGIMSQLAGMQCLFPSMSGWGIPRSLTPNFGSVCSSRRFLDDLLTLGDHTEGQGQGRSRPPEINRAKVLEQRQVVYREATLNGLALAYQQKNDIPQSAQRIANIASDAAAATDLLGKTDATNRLLVVIAEQMVAQRMLLAALLESTSATNLQSVPVNFYGPGSPMLSRPVSDQFGE